MFPIRGILLLLFLALPAQSQEIIPAQWKGLQIAPESRCSPYDRADYPYPWTLERDASRRDGGFYEAYTRQYHLNPRNTDIEHVVALSEAHDSGLCAAGPGTRQQFSADLQNITLARPEINRCGPLGKCAKDAAQWLPEQNRCWFAGTILRIRQRYSLTLDTREYLALKTLLEQCPDTDMRYPR